MLTSWFLTSHANDLKVATLVRIRQMNLVNYYGENCLLMMLEAPEPPHVPKGFRCRQLSVGLDTLVSLNQGERLQGTDGFFIYALGCSPYTP